MKYDTNYNEMEAYLLDKMSLTEKLQFELRIEQDPILQTELEIQRDTIETIQEVRRQEFKARFDEINVNANNHLILRGVIVTIGLSLTIFLSILLFQSKNKTAPLSKNTHKVKQNISRIYTEKVNTSEAKITDSRNINNPENSVKKPLEITQEAQSYSNNKPLLKPTEIDTEIKLSDTNFIEDKKSENKNSDLIERMLRISPKKPKQKEVDINEKTLKHPQLIQSTTPTPKISGFTKESVLDKPEFEDSPRLYYQFYNDNVFLYPENSEKAPKYEQLFIPHESREELNYYIYYKETYYQLYENQKTTIEAEKITDVDLLKTLNALKEKKALDKLNSIGN